MGIRLFARTHTAILTEAQLITILSPALKHRAIEVEKNQLRRTLVR